MDRYQQFLEDVSRFRGPVPPENVNYSVHISLANNYIYVETPKAACSTMKLSLISLELGYDFPLEEETSGYIHLRDWSPLLTPKQVVSFSRLLALPFLKFCFVRNPFTRVLSAYLDKIRRKTLQKKKWLSLFGDREPSAPVTFSEFLTAIARQPVDLMDSHWRPQYFQTFQEGIPYDFVGRFETFSEDFDTLTQLFGHDRPLHMRHEANHQTGAASLLDDFYSQETEHLVEAIYEVDFKHFGYSTSLADALQTPTATPNQTMQQTASRFQNELESRKWRRTLALASGRRSWSR
jgi:dermatan 4-sulfotransferase 1